MQAVWVALLLWPLGMAAQSAADEAAVRGVPGAFAAAWAKHDGHQLAAVMAEDVDFVNVGGDWLQGRAAFEAIHSRLLRGRFKDSKLTPLEAKVRFLRPDLAVLHWDWKIVGDRGPGEAAREPRMGIFTMVVEKRGGQWLVVVAQNTNWMPAPKPDWEMKGIRPGVLYPGEDMPPQ